MFCAAAAACSVVQMAMLLVHFLAGSEFLIRYNEAGAAGRTWHARFSLGYSPLSPNRVAVITPDLDVYVEHTDPGEDVAEVRHRQPGMVPVDINGANVYDIAGRWMPPSCRITFTRLRLPVAAIPTT